MRALPRLLAAALAATTALTVATAAHAAPVPVPDDMMVTVAGDGDHGPWGDDGPATAASLAYPGGVAIGADGVLYVADTDDNRVRAIGADGVMRLVAGAFQTGGFRGDGGLPANANLDAPTDVAFGPDGSLYIADMDNERVRRISPDGATITTFAGGGSCVGGDTCGDGGPATDARFVAPIDVAAGYDGSVYVVDSQDRRVRKIAPNGVITTIAGTGEGCFDGPCGDGGPATSAEFDLPVGVDAGFDGSVYVADGPASRVRRIAPDGTISAFAGTGSMGHGGDGGPAGDATISGIGAVHVTRDGTVLISESNWGTVRRVDGGGTIDTIAGNAVLGWGFSGDGGPRTTAQLDGPMGLAVGRDGAIYVADNDNDRIRAFRVAGWNPNGTIPAAPTLMAPAAGAVVTTATPTLTAAAVAGGTVTFRLDGRAVATAPVNGAGEATVTAPALSDGAHALIATVTVGPSLASEPSAARPFTVDASTPETPVDPPRTDPPGVDPPVVDPPSGGGGGGVAPIPPGGAGGAGGGGGGQSPIPPGGGTAPRAARAVLTVARAARRGRTVAVGCRVTSGAVTRCQITLRVRGRAIGAKTIVVRGTRPAATVHVILSRHGRALLRSARRGLRITVAATIRTADGRTLKAARSAVVRLPRGAARR